MRAAVQTEPTFRFQIIPDGDQTVVKLVGEADFEVVDALRDALSTALEGHPERLVLDLGETSFLDTAAARVLVSARRDARGRAVAVTVRDSGPVSRRVLELAGMFD